MRSATSIVVSTFGVLAGLAGLEHGVGEILQGNRAPEGIVIESWPDSELFRSLNGEPAMTIVPNLLVSGILTILVSLVFLVWVAMFIQRKHAGLVLLLISLVWLLVGGGFGPPLLGFILGAAATRIDAPLNVWRGLLPPGARGVLSRLWPEVLVAGTIAWLLLFPGTLLLEYFAVMRDPADAVLVLVPSAFALLFLSIVAGFARDIQHSAPTQPATHSNF